MQTLYDSESFVVVHVDANEGEKMTGDLSFGAFLTLMGSAPKPRHGFEIVDKRNKKEVYLDGAFAEIFQQQITAWQVNTPTQEECEQVLAGYAELAQLPLEMH